MDHQPRPALQLYSIRSIDRSIPDVIRDVADAGYEGIEFASRFQEAPPEAVATALAETGLVPVGVHANLSDIEAGVEGKNDLISRCQAVGCDKLVIPHLPSSHFRTRETVGSLIYRLQNVSDALDEFGIDLGLHNDRRFFWPLLPNPAGRLVANSSILNLVAEYGTKMASWALRSDSKSVPENTGIWTLLSQTRPDNIFVELEVAEVRAAGVDPLAVFSQFGGRVSMIHLRDIGSVGRFAALENVPHGEGILDFDRIMDAVRDTGIEWVVYENELDAAPSAKINDGAALLEQHL